MSSPDDELAQHIDTEASQQRRCSTPESVFITVAVGIPGFMGDDCSGVHSSETWNGDYALARLVS